MEQTTEGYRALHTGHTNNNRATSYYHFLDRRLALVGLRYSKPRISGFLKRTLKRKTFFSSE